MKKRKATERKLRGMEITNMEIKKNKKKRKRGDWENAKLMPSFLVIGTQHSSSCIRSLFSCLPPLSISSFLLTMFHFNSYVFPTVAASTQDAYCHGSCVAPEAGGAHQPPAGSISSGRGVAAANGKLPQAAMAVSVAGGWVAANTNWWSVTTHRHCQQRRPAAIGDRLQTVTVVSAAGGGGKW